MTSTEPEVQGRVQTLFASDGNDMLRITFINLRSNDIVFNLQ
jgi:hypothetical protein